MPKGVIFSAFVVFYVICIYLLSVKCLYKIFWILLSGGVEINTGPRCSTDTSGFELANLSFRGSF